MDISLIFFQLIQISIGKRARLDVAPSPEEWEQLFDIAKKQSLAGVCFAGLKKLPEEQSPGEDLVMDWMGKSISTQRRNDKVTMVCGELNDYFLSRGFNTCVLKGQSNHVYYPAEMASDRTSGDIDIWLFPKDNETSPVLKTMKFLEQEDLIVSLAYLHAELKPYKTVAIEAHFRPTFLNGPIHNHRLQKWYWENKNNCIMEKTIEDSVAVPMLKPIYNIIFQLVHIYRHLLDEGIGLRQLLDYYYLLVGTVSSLNEQERAIVSSKLCAFGLSRIAGAVMYVLQQVFLMEDHYIIIQSDEKHGKKLLSEIMLAGNFGHYDPRLKDIGQASHNTSYQVRHAARRFNRNLRFLCDYPSEVIWEPVARVAHFWWRKFKLWRF